jgi:hypothetical protein
VTWLCYAAIIPAGSTPQNVTPHKQKWYRIKARLHLGSALSETIREQQFISSQSETRRRSSYYELLLAVDEL